MNVYVILYKFILRPIALVRLTTCEKTTQAYIEMFSNTYSPAITFQKKTTLIYIIKFREKENKKTYKAHRIFSNSKKQRTVGTRIPKTEKPLHI